MAGDAAGSRLSSLAPPDIGGASGPGPYSPSPPATGGAGGLGLGLPPPLSAPKAARGKDRAHWTEPQKALLVKLLSDFNIPGHRNHNGWTKETWNRITKEMNDKFPKANLTKSQVKEQEQNMKKSYRAINKLLMQEGFEWDCDRHMLKASPVVWAPYLEGNRDAKLWHKKPFPYYTAARNLFDGSCGESGHSHGGDDNSDPVEDDEKSLPIAPSLTTRAPGQISKDIPDEDVDESFPPSQQVSLRSAQVSLHSTQGPSVGTHSQSATNIRQAQSEFVTKKRSGNDVHSVDYTAMQQKVSDSYIEAMERKTRLKAELRIEAMVKERQLQNEFSTSKCLEVYRRLEGFSSEDLMKAYKFFRDQYNREFFLSMNEAERGPWLRAIFNSLYIV